jgi:23S rRNA pseudouridine1911/1915/1917 synthase
MTNSQETFLIPEDTNTQRLDAFLTQHFPDLSRSYFQKLILDGHVQLNEKSVKKHTLIAPGDKISVSFQAPQEILLEAEDIPLDIVFEDDFLLVVNKPVGLVVHPGAGNWTHTLVNGLLYHCQNLKEQFDNPRPGIVHRLDKDTSGLLVVAKNLNTHSKLTSQFSERLVNKHYLAVCNGVPQQTIIDAPIRRHPKDRKKMAIDEEGKNAITHCEVLKTHKGLSLVSLFPKTGRTHQLRVHLQSIGCPIIGDSMYGIDSLNKKYKQSQQLLHAYKLSFTHPNTQEVVTFSANPNENFIDFIRKQQLMTLEEFNEGINSKS